MLFSASVNRLAFVSQYFCFFCYTSISCLTERLSLSSFGSRRCGSSSLRSVPHSMARQCLFRALHSQRYSFQRGGGGPGPLLSSFVLPPIFGCLFVSEPAPNLKTDPISPARARTILEISCVAMPVIGLRTLDARPPAMWFSASNKTTIKPSDQIRSNQITCTRGIQHQRHTHDTSVPRN